MFPPRASTAFKPNDWNTFEILVDANVFRASLNAPAGGGVTIDPETGSFGPVVPRIERGAAGITGGRWEETGAKTAGAIPVWPWVAPGPFSASEAVEAAVARRRSADGDAR